MKKGSIPTTIGNGFFNIIFNGLKLNSLNKASLGLLAQVTKFYSNQMEQQHNDFLSSTRPRNSQEWRIIKQILTNLYPIFGPDLLQYVKELHDAYSQEINDLKNWLEALQKLYNSAKDGSDQFHRLFLNNHNFARRAYHLAKSTSLEFSITVLEVCSECRLTSLTMNSIQLDEFFHALKDFHTQRILEKSSHEQDLEEEVPITHKEIKIFIKNRFYPKSLLWHSVASAIVR